MTMTKQTAFGWLLVFVQVLIFLGFILLPWREPSAPSLILGIIFAVCGIAIAVVTFRSLGDALTATPVPRAGVALRTQGIFGVVRHPIYSGVLLALLGLVIAVGTWWSLGWWLVAIVFFLGKSRWEDSLLRAKHRGEWEIWAQGTPALIPLRRKHAR
jgi:protein-S-isoprenylcysteine O-methyltransferase Ste14